MAKVLDLIVYFPGKILVDTASGFERNDFAILEDVCFLEISDEPVVLSGFREGVNAPRSDGNEKCHDSECERGGNEPLLPTDSVVEGNAQKENPESENEIPVRADVVLGDAKVDRIEKHGDLRQYHERKILAENRYERTSLQSVTANVEQVSERGKPDYHPAHLSVRPLSEVCEHFGRVGVENEEVEVDERNSDIADEKTEKRVFPRFQLFESVRCGKSREREDRCDEQAGENGPVPVNVAVPERMEIEKLENAGDSNESQDLQCRSKNGRDDEDHADMVEIFVIAILFVLTLDSGAQERGYEYQADESERVEPKGYARSGAIDHQSVKRHVKSGRKTSRDDLEEIGFQLLELPAFGKQVDADGEEIRGNPRDNYPHHAHLGVELVGNHITGGRRNDCRDNNGNGEAGYGLEELVPEEFGLPIFEGVFHGREVRAFYVRTYRWEKGDKKVGLLEGLYGGRVEREGVFRF